MLSGHLRSTDDFEDKSCMSSVKRGCTKFVSTTCKTLLLLGGAVTTGYLFYYPGQHRLIPGDDKSFDPKALAVAGGILFSFLSPAALLLCAIVVPCKACKKQDHEAFDLSIIEDVIFPPHSVSVLDDPQDANNDDEENQGVVMGNQEDTIETPRVPYRQI